MNETRRRACDIPDQALSAAADFGELADRRASQADERKTPSQCSQHLAQTVLSA
jgi:hypothetical protein